MNLRKPPNNFRLAPISSHKAAVRARRSSCENFAQDHRAAELISPGRQPLQCRLFRLQLAIQHGDLRMNRERHRVVHRRFQIRAFGGGIAADDPARTAFAGSDDDGRIGIVGAQSFQRQLGQGNAEPEHGSD